MQPIVTAEPSTSEAAARRTHHGALAQELTERLASARAGGPARAWARNEARGKGGPRARIDAVLDPGAPFLELSALAACAAHDGEAPGAGIVTGIGPVHGRPVMFVANDPTVKGGCYFAETVKKHVRAQEIAQENMLPCVYLVDSGGLFLPTQADAFADARHFGRIFANQARLSALGVPQVAVVLGMCTAGGAYVPAMADENIVVRGNGTIYLAGPPLVRAATGEDVDAQTLGGAEMHCSVSGVGDHLADDEAHALQLCRDVLERTGPVAAPNVAAPAAFMPPRLPPETLADVLPVTLREPFEVREVVARLVDDSAWHEFKANYGPSLVCGFARLEGYDVGVLANNGVLDGAGAIKGAHFVNLANKRGVPLLFLQHTTGFMVGSRAEAGGIAKDGAKLVQAVATARVPCITVFIGASNGAGNYAMCGRGMGPRFLFSWPNARVSVMGAEQAAFVLRTVGKSNAPDDDDDDGAALRAQFAAQSDAYYATSRLWDDGVLHPADTRRALALAFAACRNAPLAPERTPVVRL